MCRHHIVPAHVLDVKKLILCRDFRQRDDLNPVFFAVGRVHEQVAEVTRALGTFHGLADVVHVLLILRSVGHVHDKARMAAVDVILPAEQRGGLVKQG